MALGLCIFLLVLDPPPATSTAPPAANSISAASSALVRPTVSGSAPAMTAPAGPGDWALPAFPTATQDQAADQGGRVPAPVAPAPVPPVGKPQVGDILHPALWFVGVLLVAALALAWLRRLRQVEEQTPEDQAHAQLAMFRQLRDDGEITEEEFKKVLLKLQGKIKPVDGSVGSTPAPAAPPPSNGKPTKETEP